LRRESGAAVPGRVSACREQKETRDRQPATGNDERESFFPLQSQKLVRG